MSRQWVVNSSPLIVLAKISHVSLLYEACEKLVIPAGVAQEINQGPDNDPARSWLQSEGLSLIKKVEQIDPIVTA